MSSSDSEQQTEKRRTALSIEGETRSNVSYLQFSTINVTTKDAIVLIKKGM